MVQQCFNDFCVTSLTTKEKLLKVNGSASGAGANGAIQPSIHRHKVKLNFADHKKIVYFCDECYKLYKKNQKCDYCFQVYYDSAEDADMDGQAWIECYKCYKWNHTKCEVDQGKDPHMVEIATKSLALSKEQVENEEELKDESNANEDGQQADEDYVCKQCNKQNAKQKTKPNNRMTKR